MRRLLRDQSQRLSLTGAADEDRRVGTAQGLGRVQRPFEPVVLADVRAVVIAPHLDANLQGLLQPLCSYDVPIDLAPAEYALLARQIWCEPV